MRLLSRRLAGVVLLATLAGAPVAAQDDGSGGGGIDGNQAFRQWIDKPVTFDGTDGTSSRMRFDADGTATRAGGVGDVTVDSGKWRHHELGFCTTWQKDASGRERCYSIGTTGGQNMITLQGADGPSWYVRP